MDAYVKETNGTIHYLKDLQLNNGIETIISKIRAIAELALFGLVAGAVRHEELLRLTVHSFQWHNSYLYYWTTSLKKGSLKMSSMRPKLVEHQLSLTMSRIFLLIRYVLSSVPVLIQTESLPTDSLSTGPESANLLQSGDENAMLFLVRDVFELDYKPTMLNV